MWKNLVLLTALSESVLGAVNFKTMPSQEVLNADTEVFEKDFVSINPQLNLALLSDQLIHEAPVDSDFYDLPLALQYECLTYLDSQSLFMFSKSRRVFQIIVKMYACDLLKRSHAQLPSSSVFKTLTFVNDGLPCIEKAFPGFLRDRPLSWPDVAWVTVLASLQDSERSMVDLRNQAIFSLFTQGLSKDERNSIYSVYALRKLGLSLTRLLKFLFANNCRQPEIYEYALQQVPNLNLISFPRTDHILFQLIEDGLYFPALMERPELIEYSSENLVVEGMEGEFDDDDEPEQPEFYDVCYELAIEAANFPAFLGLIQMSPLRFSNLSAEDMAKLRFIFLNPSAADLVNTNHSIDYAGDRNDASPGVQSYLGRFEMADDSYNLMAILASFDRFPGQHRQIFRALYHTGAYDVDRAVQILICSGQLDALRELLLRCPEKKLKRLIPFRDPDVLSYVAPESALEVIELFALFPSFTIFDCFDVLSRFEVTPSSFLAGWIDQKDPQGKALLQDRHGVHLDDFDNPIDLLRHAVILENPDLVDFCLRRPKTDLGSIQSAHHLAEHVGNQLVFSKFRKWNKKI